MHRMSRRAVLMGIPALASVPLVAGVISGNKALARSANGRHVPSVSPLGLEDDLKNPREIQSLGGRFSTELDMVISRHDLPYASAKLRLYSGELPGPTFRVSPGDEMEIALHNRMPTNPDRETVLNTPNQFNSTNLHFHGFHVSPKGNSDNVYLQINPGESFNYLVRLPEDHPAGNYWYHPHRHGSVAVQVASGCAGMMIVSGEIDNMPEVSEAIERVMVFQCPVVDPKNGAVDSYDTIWNLDSERYWLINGEYQPRIYMREGEVQHWRWVNAGDEQFLPMTVEGLEIFEIGFDGNPYDVPRQSDKVELAPGNRANLLVRAPSAGVYDIMRPAFTQGKTPIPEARMAQVIVLPRDTDRIDSSVKMGTRIPEGPLPSSSMLADIPDKEITNRWQIVLGAKEAKGMFKDVVFTLNGEPYDPARDDIVARLNDAEEWEFVNTTPFPHPIHVHVNPMQVIKINGESVEHKRWQDTVVVPAGGTATVRMRFLNFDGRFVMHCHILPHEDLGMMLNVNIQA